LTDVLLICPSFDPERRTPHIKEGPDIGSATLPLALVYLGAFLEENDIQVKLVDTRLYSRDEALRRIKNYLNGVSLVGLSVMTRTIPDALTISDFVKSCDNNIKIVWGGIHPTLLPAQTVSDKSIDFVIVGEGEVPLLGLINHLKKGKPEIKEIPSLVYKQANVISMNEKAPPLDVNALPFPAYHLLEIDRYIVRRGYDGEWIRTLEIQTSRGCPHRCAFCVNTIINRQIYRMQQPTKVLNQLDKLINNFNLNHVIFLDENFFPSKKRAGAILKELVKYDISWIGDCRADYLSAYDSSFLSLMQKSGCKRLFIGVESGSQKVLDALKKDITVEQVINAVRTCTKYNIVPNASIMIGLPSETREDLLKTLKLMWLLKKECPKLLWSGPQLYRPYPGGTMYELCKQSGLTEPETLRQWADDQSKGFTGYLDAFPWIKDIKTFNFVLNVYIYMQILNVAEYAYPDMKTKLLAKSLARIINYRWSHNFWYIPITPKIVRLLKDKRILWSVLGQ